MKISSIQRISIIGFGVLAMSAALQAAEPGVAEVAGFGGVASIRGSAQAHFGGGAGVNLGRFVHLFGEVSYMARATEVEAANRRLVNYGGGVQIRIPTGNARIEPYGLLAFGYGQRKRDSDSGYNLYNGVGFGARVFLGAQWGIKPEFRYQTYYGIDLPKDDPVTGHGRAVAVTTGVFYQFGGR